MLIGWARLRFPDFWGALAIFLKICEFDFLMINLFIRQAFYLILLKTILKMLIRWVRVHFQDFGGLRLFFCKYAISIFGDQYIHLTSFLSDIYIKYSKKCRSGRLHMIFGEGGLDRFLHIQFTMYSKKK